MSMTSVLHSFSYSLDFLREQIADIDELQMVAQPNGMPNHPSWVLGHLTFSCQAIGGEIGVGAWLPTSWSQQFGTGSVPTPDASTYDAKDVAILSLADAERRITSAVKSLNDAKLDAPLPDEEYRHILPTIRHAVTQVLVAHTANHVGQLTIWRRMMGLPRTSRPFL